MEWAKRHDRERMSIAIDMRWVHRAFINSSTGALGGIGTFARMLWLGLSNNYPQTQLTALVEHGPLPTAFRELIEAVPNHRVLNVGLSGLIPPLDGRGRYVTLVRALESELGVAMNFGRPAVLHMIDHTPPPRGVRCPTICTLHEVPSPPPQEAYFAMFARLLKPARRATAVAFVSQGVMSAYPELASKPSAVIYNGIDTDVFTRSASPLEEEVVRSLRGRPFFMHVGLLDGRRNPVGVLSAMSRVVRNWPGDLALLSVGPYQVKPASLEALRVLAGQLGVSDRLVVMEHGASPQQLAALYSNSVGLVSPSLVEAFGYPALEALACGVPCVVSPVGGLPEVVGHLGVFVDPNDPDSIASGMLQVLNNGELRARVRSDGPVWAKRFSAEAMAHAYMRLYRLAIDTKAAAGKTS